MGSESNEADVKRWVGNVSAVTEEGVGDIDRTPFAGKIFTLNTTKSFDT
jgi:hypothetical protein